MASAKRPEEAQSAYRSPVLQYVHTAEGDRHYSCGGASTHSPAGESQGSRQMPSPLPPHRSTDPACKGPHLLGRQGTERAWPGLIFTVGLLPFAANPFIARGPGEPYQPRPARGNCLYPAHMTQPRWTWGRGASHKAAPNPQGIAGGRARLHSSCQRRGLMSVRCTEPCVREEPLL